MDCTEDITFDWVINNLSVDWTYEKSTKLRESQVFPEISSQSNELSKCYWYMNMVGFNRRITFNLFLHRAEKSDYFWTEFEISLQNKSKKEECTYISNKSLFRADFNKEYSYMRFVSTDTLRCFKNNNSHDVTITCKMKIRVERCMIHAPLKEIPDFEKLLNDSESSDCVVKTNSGKTFNVHKNILRVRSKILATEIEKMKETEYDFIPIENFDDEVVQEFLRYIYCGKIQNLDKLSKELMEIGAFAEVSDLIAICLEEMCKTINVDNAAQLLEYIHDHEVYHLKAYVLNYIVIKIKDIDEAQLEILRVPMLREIMAGIKKLLP